MALILMVGGAVAGDEEPWDKVLETDNGVVVFMRETPGTTVKEARTTLAIGAPPREDAIRVTMATGGIEIVPEDGGRSSRLRFQVIADPGGWVPGWVMNLANRKNLPDIVREIRDAAIRRARQCAKGDCRYWNAVGHTY